MSFHPSRRFAAFVTPMALFALAMGPAQVSAQSAAPAATLDGKVFLADAGIKGKAADEKDDVLSFTNGKFHSSSCDQYGYNKGDYKTIAEADGIRFETETYSEKYGKLAWRGVVRGDAIEGTFIQYPKAGFFNSNPAPIEHWFKGKVKS